MTSILEEIRYFLSGVVFLVDQKLRTPPSLKYFAQCDFRDWFYGSAIGSDPAAVIAISSRHSTGEA